MVKALVRCGLRTHGRITRVAVLSRFKVCGLSFVLDVWQNWKATRSSVSESVAFRWLKLEWSYLAAKQQEIDYDFDFC